MFEINNHKRLPSNQPVSMSCPTNTGCQFGSSVYMWFNFRRATSLFHLSYHAVVSPSLLVVSISQYHYWYLLVAPCQETQTLLRRVIYIYVVESWTTILYIPTPHVIGLGNSQIDEQVGNLEITKESKSII